MKSHPRALSWHDVVESNLLAWRPTGEIYIPGQGIIWAQCEAVFLLRESEIEDGGILFKEDKHVVLHEDHGCPFGAMITDLSGMHTLESEELAGWYHMTDWASGLPCGCGACKKAARGEVAS